MPRQRASRFALGLMSGTSADGIDAACIRIDGTGTAMRVQFVSHLHQPFPSQLRNRILRAMAPAMIRTEELARLHADLGEAFATVAIKAIRGLKRKPDVIGLAGQTICHLPGARNKTITLQLGDPARVASRTGIATVGEFRQSDVAAGGQGAPLVPWTDWVLFRSEKRARAIQNIGGIGNVTWIPAGAKPENVVAFDTGPGNMIIDGIVARVTRGRERFDKDGRRAARGQVLAGVLQAWLKHPFLKKSPPKTTGRETFGAQFIEREMKRLRAASRHPNDWVATATAFTAHSIASAYLQFLPKSRGIQPARSYNTHKALSSQHTTNQIDVILCGGGARNGTLLNILSEALPGTQLSPIDALGIPAEAKEAVSFAILAAAHQDGTPANLPQVTGANRPVLLGSLIPTANG